jgi:hypothetical protein
MYPGLLTSITYSLVPPSTHTYSGGGCTLLPADLYPLSSDTAENDDSLQAEVMEIALFVQSLVPGSRTAYGLSTDRREAAHTPLFALLEQPPSISEGESFTKLYTGGGLSRVLHTRALPDWAAVVLTYHMKAKHQRAWKHGLALTAWG